MIRTLAWLKEQYPDEALIVGGDGTWLVPVIDRRGWWSEHNIPALATIGSS